MTTRTDTEARAWYDLPPDWEFPPPPPFFDTCPLAVFGDPDTNARNPPPPYGMKHEGKFLARAKDVSNFEAGCQLGKSSPV